MLSKLSYYFCQKGYLKMNIREKEIEVCFKICADGLYFVCLIDDTNDWLKPGVLSSILETVGRLLSEKYPKYAAQVSGHAVLITMDPERSRKKCSDADPYWMIHQPTRRLMIFDDQQDSFFDAKPVLEGFLKQNAISIMLGQLRELFSPANTAIIVINIFVFVILEILGDTQSASFIHAWGGLNVSDIAVSHAYWRLFTCGFLHFGFAHLFYNMVALLYLGRPLEKALGSFRYVVLYILCLLMSSAVSTAWYYTQNEWFGVSAGASGAIMGVAGAMAFLLLKNRKQNSTFTFVRWLIFVGILVFQGFSADGETNVNNAAHIGGIISGFLVCMIFTLIKKIGKKPGEETHG